MPTIEKLVNDLEKDKWQALWQRYVKEDKVDRILTMKHLQYLPQDPKERLKIKVDLEGFSQAAKYFICWATIYGRNDRVLHGSLTIFAEEIASYFGKAPSKTAMYNALRELENADYIETLYKTGQGSCYLLKV